MYVYLFIKNILPLLVYKFRTLFSGLDIFRHIMHLYIHADILCMYAHADAHTCRLIMHVCMLARIHAGLLCMYMHADMQGYAKAFFCSRKTVVFLEQKTKKKSHRNKSFCFFLFQENNFCFCEIFFSCSRKITFFVFISLLRIYPVYT